jgi:hypothetical protein
MLHLTFVGASVRCAQGAELSVAGHRHGNASHAGMAGETGRHASHDGSHRSPGPQECCRAMAACAVTVALRAEAPSSARCTRDDAIVAPLMNAPRSPTTSPEPPPPKV